MAQVVEKKAPNWIWPNLEFRSKRPTPLIWVGRALHWMWTIGIVLNVVHAIYALTTGHYNSSFPTPLYCIIAIPMDFILYLVGRFLFRWLVAGE